MTKKYDFAVSENDSGMRLDVFLARQDTGLSRSQAQRLIEEGKVRVNGHLVKVSHKLKAGDAVLFEQEEPKPCQVLPENIPLNIVYEDESIAVVDKSAGMVVHPAAGNFQGTLVNALLFHCRNLSGIGGVLRPGIVHRLDKETSGLMVIAKSDESHRALAGQFHDHLVHKKYKALVFGDMAGKEGTVDSPVGRHPTERKKMSTISKRGKAALTRWKLIEPYGVIALLDVEIETGRTHQIRVHLNAIGHPLLGDNVYGQSSKRLKNMQDTFLRTKLKEMKRQALHAFGLGFHHPTTGRYLEFLSSLPHDMEAVCQFLRGYVREE